MGSVTVVSVSSFLYLSLSACSGRSRDKITACVSWTPSSPSARLDWPRDGTGRGQQEGGVTWVENT